MYTFCRYTVRSLRKGYSNSDSSAEYTLTSGIDSIFRKQLLTNNTFKTIKIQRKKMNTWSFRAHNLKNDLFRPTQLSSNSGNVDRFGEFAWWTEKNSVKVSLTSTASKNCTSAFNPAIYLYFIKSALFYTWRLYLTVDTLLVNYWLYIYYAQWLERVRNEMPFK